MPELPAAAAAVAEFLATEVIGPITVGQIITAAYVVGSAVDNRRRARNMAADARRAYESSLQDRSVMVRSAVEPRRMVYGYDQVSGPIADIFTTGELNEYLHLIIPVAGRQVADIPYVFLNEFAIDTNALDADGNVVDPTSPWVRAQQFDGVHQATASGSGTITLPEAAAEVLGVTHVGTGAEGEGNTAITGWSHTAGSATVSLLPAGVLSVVTYRTASQRSCVRIHKFLGAPGQTVPSALLTETGGRRTSAHVGEGLAWIWVRLRWDQEVFGSIGLPNVSALVKGHLVRDPRTSTTAWSDNAALCAADFAIDQTLGLRCASTQVPDAELSAQANICDETVAIDGTGTTQTRYNCNGSLSAADSRLGNFDSLLEAMAGHAVWTQGRWRIRAGSYSSPEPLTITEDHLGPKGPRLQRQAARRDLFNAVRATFRDPGANFTEVAAPLVTNATYEAQDGGRRVVRDRQFGMVNSAMRAQRLAKIALERARQGVTLQLQCNMRAYDLLPGQVVLVKLARYGWNTGPYASGKPFEVRQRTYDHAAGTVDYLLRETASSVWDWAYGEATAVDPAPDTMLPNPWALPDAMGSLSVSPGVSAPNRWTQADGTVVTRAVVSWTASTDPNVLQGGRVEVQWCDAGTGDWQSAPALPGDSSGINIVPVPDGRAIIVRVRAINVAGRAGPWVSAVHDVAGKSAAPSNVAGLAATVQPGGVAVSWTAPIDTDLLETEVRVGASWAAGSVVYRGKATSFVWSWPTAGTYTVRARHRNTSRVESASDATVSVTVDEAVLINVAELRQNAATAVYSASASGISVTGNTGFPTGSFTDLVSYTWTPPYDCDVVITAEGWASISTPASGANADYASFSTRIISNSTTLGATRNYAVDDQIGYSKSIRVATARVQRFAATGGVAYTVKCQGQQPTNLVTTTVDEITMRIEEIRR